MTTKRVSVAEAKRELPRILKQSENEDILVFNERKGALAGAIISAETYGQVSRVRAYLDALRISGKTKGRSLQVTDLIRRSRSELEGRRRGSPERV